MVNYRSDLNAFGRFADARGLSLEDFQVRHWSDFLREEAEKGKSRAHLQRVRAALGNYWKFALDQEPALRAKWEGRDPFAGSQWPARRKKLYRPEAADFRAGDDAQARFDPALVPGLWDAAHAMGNADLRDAIIVAAHTGCRREGVFRLHRKAVFLEVPIPYLQFHEKSSWRMVPIPDAILPLIRWRYENPAQKDFLFRGGENEKESRGARMTNPMRRLLTARSHRDPRRT